LVDTWLDELDEETYDLVMAALELLGEHGPSLGRPLVDSICGLDGQEHEGASTWVTWAQRTSNAVCLRPAAKGHRAGRSRQSRELGSLVQAEASLLPRIAMRST
jgi:hypothetical protein